LKLKHDIFGANHPQLITRDLLDDRAILLEFLNSSPLHVVVPPQLRVSSLEAVEIIHQTQSLADPLRPIGLVGKVSESHCQRASEQQSEDPSAKLHVLINLCFEPGAIPTAQV
jgi:hypothetical protein